MSVSVVVLARDEAARIERCLGTLGFAREIVVVVDAASTDDTETIARRFTPHVHVRPLTSFGEQREWANGRATSEWIFWVDCDELVSPELAAEIGRAVADDRFVAYRVPRLDYMFGRWIRHGGWYPQYHVRLTRCGRSRWEGRVHEQQAADGAIGTLSRPVLHFAHGRVVDWVAKMTRYTSLEAEEAFRAGRRTAAWRMLLEPPAYAGYKYVVQQGFRDGAHGLVLALLMGVYRLVHHLKLWDLQRAANGRDESRETPPSTSAS